MKGVKKLIEVRRMFISYNEIIIRSEDIIQKLANILSKLEIKAINRHIKDVELYKIIELYLSKREQNIYYKSKFELRKLLNK